MAHRRIIEGALDNFLGTFTSRYADYRGYWLFGWLVADLGAVEFDLLAEAAGWGGSPDSPLDVARRAASHQFADQVRKAGLAASRVRRARLEIARLPGTVARRCHRTGRDRAGSLVAFRAGAETDDGREHRRERVVFVAPHDPQCEGRRAPDHCGVGRSGRVPPWLR